MIDLVSHRVHNVAPWYLRVADRIFELPIVTLFPVASTNRLAASTLGPIESAGKGWARRASEMIGSIERGRPLYLRARHGMEGGAKWGNGPIDHTSVRPVIGRHQDGCGLPKSIGLLLDGYLPGENRPAGIRALDGELPLQFFCAAP